MSDVIVRGAAIRWVDDEFPGWIEVSVVAADGRARRIVQKVPVLTSSTIISAEPEFPLELWVAGTSGRVDQDTADVTFANGVATTDGVETLTFATKNVVWL